MDRYIVQTALTCTRIRSEDECTGIDLSLRRGRYASTHLSVLGDCEWNEDNSCSIGELSEEDLFLSESDDDPRDPVCLLFANALEYDCRDQETADACNETENCEWNLVRQGRRTIIHMQCVTTLLFCSMQNRNPCDSEHD